AANVFALAGGAGGTPPQHSVARVTTPSPQTKIAQIHLTWPPPPPAAANVTFVPAFDVRNARPEQMGQILKDFTPVTPGTMQGSFDGSTFTVQRVGNTVSMVLNVQVDSQGVDVDLT